MYLPIKVVLTYLRYLQLLVPIENKYNEVQGLYECHWEHQTDLFLSVILFQKWMGGCEKLLKKYLIAPELLLLYLVTENNC